MKNTKFLSGKTREISVFLIALIVLFSISACSLFKKKYEKTERKEYTVNTINKKKVTFDNTNGNIKVIRNSSDSLLRIKAEITIRVSKKELDENIEKINMDIDSSGNTINIRPGIVKEKHFFNFSFNFNENEEYQLIVPDGLDVVIDNTNGKIDVSEVTGNVKISSTNGSVKFKNTPGKLNAELTNGKITADIDSTKGIDFRATNGSVTLNLGNSFSGNFKLETVNGKITTKDFDFKKESKEKRTFTGKLGDSDAEIRIETTNGKITLNKK